MRKVHLIVIIPFILGLCCFIAFNLIGSHVAPDGTLIEPFALIPIGYIFIVMGIIFEIIIVLISVLKK